MQSVGRVDRIHDHRFSVKIGERLDCGLHHQLVLRALAAHHDDYVLMGEFHHGHVVVHGEIGKIAFPRGKVGAKLLGIFLVVVDDFQAVLRENSLLIGNHELQRPAQQREYVNLLFRGSLPLCLGARRER